MKLEELIYKRFTETEDLTKRLTKYLEKPAVFSPSAPEQNMDGWKSGTHYPRAVFNLELQASEERKSAGTLLVTLLCQNTAEVVPEDIEPEVRKCLRDVLLFPDGGTVYAFAWARTDAFEVEEKKNSLLIGCEIRFDILEYTSQETTDPDPVVATNRYIKKLYPNCRVIGLDEMEEIAKASKDEPIVYCRLMSLDKAEETNTVAWMDGRIAVHILCPDSSVRLKMIAAITNEISLDGEIIMMDRSPMFIKKLQMDNKSDFLKDGQIFITGHYGLLRYKAKQPGLNNPQLKV